MFRVNMLWTDYSYAHRRDTWYNDVDGSAALTTSLQNYSQQFLDSYLVGEWTKIEPYAEAIYANLGAATGAIFPVIDSGGLAARFWIPGIRFDLFDTSGYYVDLTSVEDFTTAVLVHGSSQFGRAIGSIQPAHADTAVHLPETLVSSGPVYKCWSKWRDYHGRVRLYCWWQVDNSTDILFAAQEYSALACIEYLIGQMLYGPESPPEEGPGSLTTSARLRFHSTADELVEVNLPAPADFIIANDGRHINPAACAPLISDCLSYALSPSGAPLDKLLYTGLRQYREPASNQPYYH